MRRLNAYIFWTIAFLAGVLAAIPVEAQVPRPFRLLTARMSQARAYHTATLLDDGRVLIVGGPSSTAATELFDPVSETFSAGPTMTSRRYLHTATKLPSGDVLIAGGSANPGTLASVEIYRAATGTLERIADMPGPRAGHTATLLNDGTVLLVGGTDNVGRLSSAVIFNPATGTFAPTDSMNQSRIGHEATLLQDGTVLVSGGAPVSGTVSGSRSFMETYDPSTGLFETTHSMPAPRYFHTATQGGGGVMIFGGVPDPTESEPLGTGETVNHLSSSSTPNSHLTLPRSEHTATTMPDGSTLFVGGNLTAQLARMVESYRSAAGTTTVTIAGFLVIPRVTHTATVLTDGRLLILGGMDHTRQFTNSAEIYPGPDPNASLVAQIAALTSQVADLQDQVAGFDSERAALLAEIERLQTENDELRRLLANAGAPTGTGGMSGSGQVVVGRQRNVFDMVARKSPDGNLKLALAFKVCQQLETQADDDLTCFSSVHRLTVTYFTAVQFSDDPSFVPSPDPAKQGVDRMVLSGVGSWDGVDGHRFTVTATDRGDDAGPNTDTFEIVITTADGTVVTTIVGTLAAGNLEAQ
jgi:hypothetical protein